MISWAAVLGRVRRCPPRVREYAAVVVAFLLGRYLLDLLGMRLNFSVDWMFLSDPADLRERLFETTYYSHSFPPGMNLLTGLLLKLGDRGAVEAAHAVFQALGLVLVCSLFYLGRAMELRFAAAFGLATAFSLIPQVIYFEHLYLYTYPTASLLALAAALFHRAVVRPSFSGWLACFITCALIGWIRSVFHLAWFAVMVGLALWFVPLGARRRVLLGALGPTVVLLALYVKNLAVFGVFGALTFGPANLTTATIRNLPVPVRDLWIKEGKLTPFAAISVYDGPRAYLPFFPAAWTATGRQ